MKALTDWLASSEQFFHQLGWFGIFAYALLMAAAGLVAAPLSVFAVTAGAIFGPIRGFLAIEMATVLSAAANFLIARYVARGPILARVSRNPKFGAIDQAIGREGWKIVALLRCVPIPFGFMNYALGLTAIPFWQYLVATALAIIPGNIFFAWLGATAHAGLTAATGAGRPHHPMETVFMVVGLVAAFSAMFYVTKVAKAAVARAGIETS